MPLCQSRHGPLDLRFSVCVSICLSFLYSLVSPGKFLGPSGVSKFLFKLMFSGILFLKAEYNILINARCLSEIMTALMVALKPVSALSVLLANYNVPHLTWENKTTQSRIV